MWSAASDWLPLARAGALRWGLGGEATSKAQRRQRSLARACTSAARAPDCTCAGLTRSPDHQLPPSQPRIVLPAHTSAPAPAAQAPSKLHLTLIEPGSDDFKQSVNGQLLAAGLAQLAEPKGPKVGREQGLQAGRPAEWN